MDYAQKLEIVSIILELIQISVIIIGWTAWDGEWSDGVDLSCTGCPKDPKPLCLCQLSMRLV